MPVGLDAREYHEETKHDPETIGGGSLDFTNKPRPYKEYGELPRVELSGARLEPSTPALDAISLPPPTEGPTVERATVLELCYYATGITKRLRLGNQDREFRAAACTGALYHIDLYAVCGDLPDLQAGVYHYDPRSDTLERLRTGDYRGVLVDASRDAAVEHAPITFVATSTWWRNAWKYQARTYRHAFWDSGTIIANLLATAHATNRPATTVLGFADDAVVDLLGLDPGWEAPLELIPVGAGTATPEPKPIPELDLETAPLDSDPVESPRIYEAWRGSTLPDGGAAEDWRNTGDRPIDGRGPGDGDWTVLDPVDRETASNRPLHNTIHRRGSCRAYVRDDLSFRKVSTVLDRAFRGVPMDVRASDGSVLQFVDCYCIVNGVADIDPGAYQYHPEQGVLEVLHTGAYREEAEFLALGQALGGDAAVCVYFLADLDAITETLGNRGYRAAQLEAALTAGRLYLATYAHRDLGGTGLTFFDDEVTAFFEPRASTQTPMFLYTLGRPA